MDPGLEKLAEAFGVASSYEDWQRRPVEVPEETVRRVLQGLGVDVEHPDEALRRLEEQRWRRLIPPTVVAVQGARTTLEVRAPDGGEPVVELTLEDGSPRPLETPGPPTEHTVVAGHRRVVRPLVLPPDLPLGYHHLRVVAGFDAAEESSTSLIVVPARAPLPPGMERSSSGRNWGWMVQLY